MTGVAKDAFSEFKLSSCKSWFSVVQLTAIRAEIKIADKGLAIFFPNWGKIFFMI